MSDVEFYQQLIDTLRAQMSIRDHKINQLQAAFPSDPDSVLVNEAMSGARGIDQKRIAEEGLAFVAMLLRKNHDYGGSAWQVPVLAPEMNIDAAIRVRMSDKIARISRLMTQTAEVKDEKVEDTIRDLGAYCLLWLARPKGRLVTEGGEG